MKKIILLSIVFVSVACTKNKLKIPTEFSVMMKLNKEFNSSNTLKFNTGTVRLESIGIEGERIKGDDVDFVRDFGSGLNMAFDKSNSNLNFDVPQGVYRSISIFFETTTDNSNASISVLGDYISNTNDTISIICEFQYSESFEIEIEDTKGSLDLTLDKDNPKQSVIKFDPIYWFEIVPNSMLENANTTNVNGKTQMYINESVNEDIYELVVDRIEESTKIYIQ